MANLPYLTNSELERISNILGETSSGFTGSEISRLLAICNIPDALPNGTIRCCREELLQDNYFHAVFEAAKSLTDRIACETELNLDGTQLIERAFSLEHPAVVMNKLETNSEKNQHRGLKEMLLGVNYSVRNVTAHELKIKWAINEDKAINMLNIISSLW